MDSEPLKRFTAFARLSSAVLQQLAAAGQEQRFGKNETLFKRGDAGDTAVYLLEGQVRTRHADGREQTLGPEDAASTYPLGNLNPRPFDLIAVSKVVRVFSIDRETQDRLLSLACLNESASESTTTEGVVVQETAVDPEWLFRILQTPAFVHMPADRLDRFMSVVEQVEYPAGEVVVRQGEPGDYYYLIQKGSVTVEREQGTVRFPIATLQAGSAFGEEALLQEGAVRNATVRMAEDGTLVRLHRDDFRQLLEPTFVHTLSHQDLPEVLKSNSHQLVDVRLQPEFARHHLKGSINLPLFQLRKRMDELPRNKPLLLVCDSGVQSRTAAFILSEQGFDTCVLEGGLSRLRPTDKHRSGENRGNPPAETD